MMRHLNDTSEEITQSQMHSYDMLKRTQRIINSYDEVKRDLEAK